MPTIETLLWIYINNYKKNNWLSQDFFILLDEKLKRNEC